MSNSPTEVIVRTEDMDQLDWKLGSLTIGVEGYKEPDLLSIQFSMADLVQLEKSLCGSWQAHDSPDLKRFRQFVMGSLKWMKTHG